MYLLLVNKRKGTSLEEQERLGIELAKSKGMNYEVFNEGSISGSDKKDPNIGDWVDSLNNRPVLTNLMNLVREKSPKEYRIHRGSYEKETEYTKQE